MSLPMLQVALDNQTMDSAYETTRLIAEEVDIIEVGTILCVGEGVRGGTIDMEMSGSNNFTGLSPVINLLDVPFLFRDTAHAHKTLDGKVGDDLKVSLEGKGLKVLAYWENGWRDVTNSRAPVKTPADLKGLKIRTNNSPMNIAAFKVFGANPIPMPFAEVYTGLETRTIDAQEHPINVVWSAKFYEVQKYLSLTHHAYSPQYVVNRFVRFHNRNVMIVPPEKMC